MMALPPFDERNEKARLNDDAYGHSPRAADTLSF
jgi:hypothetical protein